MSQEVRSQWVYPAFCLLLVITRMTFMWQPKRFWVFFFYIAWECVSLMVADHWGHPSTMGEQTVQSSTQVQNNACSSYPVSNVSKGSETEEQGMPSCSSPSSAVACWGQACLTVLSPSLHCLIRILTVNTGIQKIQPQHHRHTLNSFKIPLEGVD